MKRLRCSSCHEVIRIVTAVPTEEHGGGTMYVVNRKLRESELFPTIGLCSSTECELHGTHQPLKALEALRR